MGCATKGYSTVYTRISYFHDWIESHIRDNTTVNHRILHRCHANEQQCGCSFRNVILSPSSIVKRENALPHSWSMIVSIRAGASHQHICSGTVFEESHVLTTAHCVANRSAEDITIEGGMYTRSESGAIIRQVKHINIHPNYTAHSNSFMSNIAVLQLTEPLDLTEDNSLIRQTCLSPTDDRWTKENMHQQMVLD